MLRPRKRAKKPPAQPQSLVDIEKCFYCKKKVGANHSRHLAQCGAARKQVAARANGNCFRGSFVNIRELQGDQVLHLIGHRQNNPMFADVSTGDHSSMGVEPPARRNLHVSENNQTTSRESGSSLSLPLVSKHHDPSPPKEVLLRNEPGNTFGGKDDDGFLMDGEDDSFSGEQGSEAADKELDGDKDGSVLQHLDSRIGWNAMDLVGDAVNNDFNFDEMLDGDNVETTRWTEGAGNVQFHLRAERMSYEEEKAAWDAKVQERQCLQGICDSVGSTNGYLHIPHWSWKLPPGSSHALPQTIVEDGMIGVCMQVPPNSHVGREQIFSDSEVSMIRLVDYMDMRPKNSRKTLDGLIKIIREETEDRAFDPRLCPSRQTISEKVKKKYGMGQHPQVAQLTVSSSTVAACLVEKEIGDDGEGKKSAWRIRKEAEMSDRYSVNIIAFSVRDGILDLLDDMDIFGEMNNLMVNLPPDNPFAPYQNRSNFSADVLDGTWYSETVQNLLELDPTKTPFVPGLDFLVPLMIYMDKTGNDINQRYPLEPVIFTLAIIKRFLRNYTRSWRIAGYIPDLESKSSAEMAENRRRNPGATTQSYHLALGFILRGLALVQEEGIVTWLRLGSYQKRVRLRIEVAFVMGDGKSADMLTCRVPSHHERRRVSRCCRTLQADCDRVLQKCKYIETGDVPAQAPIKANLRQLFLAVGMAPNEIEERMPSLKPVVEEPDEEEEESNKEKKEEPRGAAVRELVVEALNLGSFHPAPNAFVNCGIRFGGDPRSIWGANPIDLMHAFQSGIVMYVVKMAMDKLTPGNQVKLDKLVHRLFGSLRCRERTNGYPRTNFSKGFSKVSLITSNEWMGKLFVLFLVLCTKSGDPLFKNIFGSKNVLEGVQGGGHTFSEANVEKQIAALEESANELKRSRLRQKSKIKTKKGKEPTNGEGEEVPVEEDEDGNKKQKQEMESMHRKCSRADFIELAEALLTFHAWSRLDMYPVDPVTKKIPTETYRRSIQKMLAMVRFYMPRENGRGWGIQKFHDLLHLVDDMERFGPSQCFNCQCGESGLIYWAKKMAATAQMRGYNTFCEQCASRQFEYNCFAKAKRQNMIVGVDDRSFLAAIERNKKAMASAEEVEIGESSCSGKTFRVYKHVQGSGPTAQTEVHGRKKRKSQFHVHPVIEDFMRDQENLSEGNEKLPEELDKQDRPHWTLHTEATIATNFNDPTGKPQDPFLVRADPDYKKEGPWYDWIMVEFEGGNESFELDKTCLQYPPEVVPAKVLALANHPETGVVALVHPCEFRTKEKDQKDDSVLTEIHHLHYSEVRKPYTQSVQVECESGEQVMHQIPRERVWRRPQLVWVGVESIVGPCFVIEENPGIHEELEQGTRNEILEQCRIMLVLPHNRWSGKFTSVM